jgi:hypothetical protein
MNPDFGVEKAQEVAKFAVFERHCVAVACL